MLKKLEKFFGMADESAPSSTEYDPVYGLPKRAVREWLARNPRLREEYEVQEWLVHNPPLREDHERTVRQGKASAWPGHG